MMYLCHLFWLGLIVVLHSGSSLALTDDDSEGDGEVSRVKRSGWSMLRLGRGLQMLRLGKRALPIIRMGRSSAESTVAMEELRNLLSSVLEDRRFSSRQVPVPRYGKDLSWQNEYEQGLGDSSVEEKILRRSGMPLDTDDGLPHVRPAPRGGRYRRSELSKFYDFFPKLNYIKDKQRAVALPRIGRNEVSKERAVPVPRIG